MFEVMFRVAISESTHRRHPLNSDLVWKLRGRDPDGQTDKGEIHMLHR